MDDQRSLVRVLLQPMLVAVAAALLIRSVVQAYSIPSASMSPTLEVGDHILVTRYSPLLLQPEPRRGDVVVFHLPGYGEEVFVKRVVGLPGETMEIDNDQIAIGGTVLSEPYLTDSRDTGFLARTTVPPDRYFVMGDNRGHSLDSRAWGPISRDMIIGKARIVFWSSGNGASDASARAMAPDDAQPNVSKGVRWRRILELIR